MAIITATFLAIVPVVSLASFNTMELQQRRDNIFDTLEVVKFGGCRKSGKFRRVFSCLNTLIVAHFIEYSCV